MQNIYFDYASTTPVDPLVLNAMQTYLKEKFGNASSAHSFGQEARKAIEDSRQTVAEFLGAKPGEIIFTSGGTESNNQALFGIARSLSKKGNHIIVSSIEHHSVIRPAEFLESQGFKVTYVPVDQEGVVDVEAIKQAIGEQTILVSVMFASNEIGTIQPIEEIAKITKQAGVVFHTDAVQVVGHMPVDVNELGVDLLSLSGHKFYGPKGIGALYIREGIKIAPFLLGGDQERGLRASTENLAGIVGLAAAIDICRDKMDEENIFQAKMRDKIIEQITDKVSGVILNGHATKRLSNNVHFSFDRVQGEELLMSLDMNGIATSMGSACTSGAMEVSHVLRAIGLCDDLAYGALRITLGRGTTEKQVDYLLEQLPAAVERLRI